MWKRVPRPGPEGRSRFNRPTYRQRLSRSAARSQIGPPAIQFEPSAGVGAGRTSFPNPGLQHRSQTGQPRQVGGPSPTPPRGRGEGLFYKDPLQGQRDRSDKKKKPSPSLPGGGLGGGRGGQFSTSSAFGGSIDSFRWKTTLPSTSTSAMIVSPGTKVEESSCSDSGSSMYR